MSNLIAYHKIVTAQKTFDRIQVEFAQLMSKVQREVNAGAVPTTWDLDKLAKHTAYMENIRAAQHRMNARQQPLYAEWSDEDVVNSVIDFFNMKLEFMVNNVPTALTGNAAIVEEINREFTLSLAQFFRGDTDTITY